MANNKGWSEHHKVILQIQMLASMDDPTRYQKAMELATSYIDSGKVEWFKGYLKMQRGFLHNLSGDRKSGNKDLQSVVDGQLLSGFGSVDDPVVKSMKFRYGNLELSFDNVMRQSIGHYYLDFNKKGMDADMAFQYFNGIRSSELRDKCMVQLKNRTGNDYEELVRKNSRQGSVEHPGSAGSGKETDKITQPKRGERKKLDRNAPASSKQTESGFYFWLVAASALLACSTVWWMRNSSHRAECEGRDRPPGGPGA